MSLARFSAALAALALFPWSVLAQSFTWTGASDTNWNTATNWFPSGIPNSVSAAVNFTGNALGTVNISSSVSAQSLSFTNATGSYTLTSSAGVGLSSVTSIAVGPAVTGLQTINLANISTGSLLFPSGSNLTITNNSIAAGTTLLIGPNTVIGTPGNGGVVVNGVGTTQISGVLSAASPNNIVGGLTMNGAGTLILSNASNTYSGGTMVNAGTLLLGSGTAIPMNSNVTVAASATFNTGGLSNGSPSSSSNAIGTLTLNGGTFRVPTGNGDYWLNQFVMSDGTVDFTGTSNSWLHFTGASAGITINSGVANWIGAGNSRIQNDTGNPLTIYVNGNTLLNAGIILSAGGANANFVKTGFGSMRLSNTGNTANITAASGYLYSNDLSTNLGVGAFGTLGTGTFTLNGGSLIYDGPTAVSAKPITLSGGGAIQVLTPGANLTLSGVIGESAASSGLDVGGAAIVVGSTSSSSLSLTANNNFSGIIIVEERGIIAVPTIGNAGNGGINSPLGASSNSAVNLHLGFFLRGDLLLTGVNSAYSTDRGVTISGDYLSAGGGGIGVQNAGTTLTWNGPITGNGSLIKTGAGTLTLTNTNNDYLYGTYIDAGTLNLALSGPVIPANSDVTVKSTGVLQVGFTSGNNFLNPINTLTLDGGTLHIPTGTPTYDINRLVSTANGGTVDLSGSTGVLQFTGNGSGVTIGGNTTWTSDNLSSNVYISVATLNLNIAPSATLTNHARFVGRMQVTGGGTLYVTTPSNTSNVDYTVSQGRLRVDDLSMDAQGGTVLGVGFIYGFLTLDGGALQYSGGTASSGIPIALTPTGGTVEVANPATSLTLTGRIDAAPGSFGGPLVKSGPGILILDNPTNTYAGGITVNAGRLDVASDAQLGAASVTVNPAGTLRYTANNSTARTFNLNGGVIEAPSGVTLALNGATVNGGFLRGAGTFGLNGAAVLNGVTTYNGSTLNQTGAALLANFTNGGTLTNNSGTTLTWNGGLNQSSGNVTINGTANVSDWTHDGILNVPAGGVLNNVGASNLVFGGGSTTFVGSVANPGGNIDLGGQQLIVRGGLLVTNSGSFISGNGVRNGATVADYGALVKGTGPYQAVITQNGGQYLPGNSPGTSQVGQFFVNGGGNLIFEITDAGPSASFPSAQGTAGNNPGWGLTQIFSSLEFTATPSNKFNIEMRTQLAPPAAPNTPGLMSSFDPTRAYSWLIFDLQPGAVFNGTFNPNAINFITTQFANPTASGQFSLSRTGGQVFLTFTPVPEPALILGVAFVGMFGWSLQRRRRYKT